MLLLVILQNPTPGTAQDDLRKIGDFIGFLSSRLTDDGFDVQRLLNACTKLRDVAACAVHTAQPRDQAESPSMSSTRSVLLEQLDVSITDVTSQNRVRMKLTNFIQSVRGKLLGVKDWLQLAQGFLSNLPMLQAGAEEVLSDISGLDTSQGRYGLFVPELFKSQL